MDLSTAVILVLALWRADGQVQLEDFQKYGVTVGDNFIRSQVPNIDLDDGSSPEIPLSFPFRFFNETFHSLYVNINGGVSFRSRISAFTPECKPMDANMAMISPFWADVDLRSSIGNIFYRQVSTLSVLDKAKGDIVKAFSDHRFDSLALKWALVATWENVPFYDAVTVCPAGTTGLFNTFQLTLTTDGTHSFALFYYNKIQWTTGTASGGNNCTGHGGKSARAGFDNGEGTLYYITGSCTDDMLRVTSRSTQNETGKYVFQIDSNPTGPGTATIPHIDLTTPSSLPTKPTQTTNPPVQVTTEDSDVADRRQDVRDDINYTSTLANEICPGLIDHPALQQECFDQWIIIDNQMIEEKTANTVHELTDILHELDKVSDNLDNIKDAVSKSTKAPATECPSDTRVNRRCKEVQKNLDKAYDLAKNTCPLLIDYPALQKDCFNQWIKIDNDQSSFRKTTTIDGFEVIETDVVAIEERLKKIRSDVGWH